MRKELKDRLKENPPRNIIVRMPNWLGDLVMATPVLRDLKQMWPDAKITAMCQSPLAVLLEHDPSVDEIFSFQRVSGWVHRQENRDVIGKLQEGHYDLGVLLTGSLSSGWWFWRGGVQNRIGYRGRGRNLLMTKAVGHPARIDKMHQVVFYKRILRELGVPVSSSRPAIYISEEESFIAGERFANLGVNDNTILVGVNPAAAYGPAKQWPAERFREVIEGLLEDPLVRVVVFGDQSGRDLAKQLSADLGSRVINLAGKTSLRELASLTQKCNLFISNDSGPMHLAAALRVPLIALFGSTSPARTRPYEWGQVIYKNVSCSPCYKRECPIDFRCMTRIESDEVLKAAQAVIKKSYRSG